MGGEEFNPGGGALIIGTKGKLIYKNCGSKPRLLPASLQASVGAPAPRWPGLPTRTTN